MCMGSSECTPRMDNLPKGMALWFENELCIFQVSWKYNVELLKHLENDFEDFHYYL